MTNTLLNQTTSLSAQSLLDAIAFLNRCFDLTIVANDDDDTLGGDGHDPVEDSEEEQDTLPRA